MDATIQWFLNLLSPAEWRAILWLLLVTMAAVHTIKITWRNYLPLGGGGGGHIAAIAAAASLVAAYFVWPAGGVHWAIAGIVGGPASNVAFKRGFALLKRFVPDLAATVNMDRRKVWGLPPTDRKPWRKEDG